MNAARETLLVVIALGVLGIAWGAYSRWSEDSRPSADGPAATGVTPGHPAAAPRKFPAHPVARVSTQSERPASERANPGTPERQAAPDESFAPCFDPATEPATEQPMLQALDEPDDESRYQRLLETMGSGAEVPVDRMHVVLATDPSNKVRDLALTALTEHPDATPEQVRAIATGALADPSPAVRTHAERILEEMNESQRIERESGDIQHAM